MTGPVVSAQNLSRSYPVKGGVFSRPGTLRAL